MPCFSASNRRHSQSLSENHPARAKTAIHSIYDSNRGNATNKNQQSSARQCNASAPNAKKNRIKTERKVSLPIQEYNRLKAAAKVVTLEERLDILVRKEQEMKRLEEESLRSKQYFKEIDDARKKAEEAKSTSTEGEEANEKVKVLEKAFIAKHEQEEQVKKANSIILNAKCHAIRDAQVQEKYEIKKELKRDEERLEKQVIETAVKALIEEDAKHERLHHQKQIYASEIKQQLHERATARFLEAERIEEEAKALRQFNEALKRDEIRQAQLAKERRLKYSQDLAKVMEMSIAYRRILCEQEREAEMRIAAYMKARDERLAALQAEQKLAKQELERKQQLIYNLAEKVLQSKSDREEMSYLTEQERIEREYRRKEKEAAMRKRQFEKDLAAARERQLQETTHCRALQIAREEQDFNRLIASLKEAEAKQKYEDDQRLLRGKCYNRDIIQQIGDNEMKRRQLQELERRQASAWRESERQRDANIRAIITAKVNAMREACLPEKYIKDVEMQLTRIVGKGSALSKLSPKI